jgi:hypothetical protein
MKYLHIIKNDELEINTKQYFFNLLFILKTLYFIFFASLLVFARPVLGINFFGYRIGELAVVLAFFISILFFILPEKIQSLFFKNRLMLISHKLIILSFFVLAFVSNSNFLSSYTYKVSSYIWTISFFYLGILLIANFKVEKFNPLMFMSAIPLVTYIISTGNYPNFIMQFFIDYSDKFQFLKPSDIFLGYIVTNFVNRYIFKSKKSSISYLVISTALMAPLLLLGSRGSFLGMTLFFLFELFNYRYELIKNWKNTLLIFLIGLIVLIFSTSRIDFENNSNITLGEDFTEYLGENISPIGLIDSLREFENKKDTVRVFFSFYWHYGRLESTDSTTNWRLDIWQDIFYGMVEDGRIIKGYGYKEVFPQMLDPTAPGRLGRDGLNEHIHNYFMNIFARGGILQLLFFLMLHYSFIKYWKEQNGDRLILNFMIPCLIVSSLDVTMEGVHFPLIYYSFLFFFLNISTKVNKII